MGQQESGMAPPSHAQPQTGPSDPSDSSDPSDPREPSNPSDATETPPSRPSSSLSLTRSNRVDPDVPLSYKKIPPIKLVANPRVQHASQRTRQLGQKIVVDAPVLVDLRHGTIRYRPTEKDFKGAVPAAYGGSDFSEKTGYFYHPKYKTLEEGMVESPSNEMRYVFKGATSEKSKRVYFIHGDGLDRAADTPAKPLKVPWIERSAKKQREFDAKFGKIQNIDRPRRLFRAFWRDKKDAKKQDSTAVMPSLAEEEEDKAEDEAQSGLMVVGEDADGSDGFEFNDAAESAHDSGVDSVSLTSLHVPAAAFQ